MNARKLLNLVVLLVNIPAMENEEADKQEIKKYIKTPVFIHHESNEGGVCFSFMYNGTVYRFQRVGNEVYGPFEEKEWQMLDQDYEAEGLAFGQPLMYAEEFQAEKGDKAFYSPAQKSVVKLIKGNWFALRDGEVELVESEPVEA